MIPIPIAQPIQWQPSYTRRIGASTKNEWRRVWNNLGWIDGLAYLNHPSFNLLFASFFPIFGSSDSPTINQLGPWSLSTSLLNVFFSSLNFLVVNCCFPGDLHLTHVCFCFRKKRNLKSGLECSSARFNFLFTKNTKRELNFFY